MAARRQEVWFVYLGLNGSPAVHKRGWMWMDVDGVKCVLKNLGPKFGDYSFRWGHVMSLWSLARNWRQGSMRTCEDWKLPHSERMKKCEASLLGAGLKQHFFLFSPRNLGRWSNLTNMFQMGLNHQLVYIFSIEMFPLLQLSWSFHESFHRTQWRTLQRKSWNR